MSLLYTDGFDEKDHAGWNYNPGSPAAAAFVTGRLAGSALALYGVGSYHNSQWIKHAIQSASSAYYIGFGFTTVGTSVTWGAGNNSGPGHGLVLYGNTGGTARLHVGPGGTGYLEVRQGTDSSGTLLGTGTTLLQPGTWYYIEVYALINSTTGAVTVRLNGANEIVLTGVNTQNGGSTTTVDTILLGGPIGLNGANQGFAYDDLYVCDGAGTVNNTFLGDVQVLTEMPSGNGAANSWVNDAATSTNNYTHVDDVPDSTASYVQSAVVGAVDEYAIPAIAGSPTVFGVQARALASKVGSGSRSAALVARPGTTDHADAGHALGTGAVPISNIWETNPDTSTAWTAAALSATQFGVKVSA